MNFNMYKEEAYRIAKEHGFHEQEHSDDHLKCLIISELMEAVEADRKGLRADQGAVKFLKAYGRLFEKNFLLYVKDTVEDELADACIRICDLAGLRNIDLDFGGQQTVEIEPTKLFTENILTICRFIAGGGTADDLYIRLNYSLSMICTLAAQEGIDLRTHIELKMAYNRTRPKKHGKGY